MGADDRSGPRITTFLNYFSSLHKADSSDISWITSEGRMGTEWIPSGINLGEIGLSTNLKEKQVLMIRKR